MTDKELRRQPKITDHKFIPCHHEKRIEQWGGDPMRLCMNPYGPYRCHKRDCGRTKEEHEA